MLRYDPLFMVTRAVKTGGLLACQRERAGGGRRLAGRVNRPARSDAIGARGADRRRKGVLQIGGHGTGQGQDVVRATWRGEPDAATGGAGDSRRRECREPRADRAPPVRGESLPPRRVGHHRGARRGHRRRAAPHPSRPLGGQWRRAGGSALAGHGGGRAAGTDSRFGMAARPAPAGDPGSLGSRRCCATSTTSRTTRVAARSWPAG